MSGALLAAYAVVSLVWGSTYLAIRVGVQHMPPALFGGIRFTTAGVILLILALALGRRLPRRPVDWARSAVVGIMLLTIGNGMVIWAEQYIESGAAAILVVTGALWMAMLDAVIPGSEARPTWRQFTGLVVGFAGVALLIGSGVEEVGRGGILPVIALIGASASWALGSIYAKRRPVDASPYVHAALQMCSGGIVLLAIGAVLGETRELRPSLPGLGAVAYLIVFGSIVAYTSYVYLLRHAQPAFVGTHVYVNTVVAVLLGWIVLDEHVTLRTFVAMGIVLGAVLWVRRAEARPRPEP
jgi:drug/metabolite transporter (DMT)-like permease